MILVYCEKISPRLVYSARTLLSVLDEEVSFTSSIEEAKEHTGPRIWYCQLQVAEGVHVYPAGLLTDRGINDITVPVMKWKHTQALFPSPHHAGFPFDVFSAAFYMLSRYEEYLPHRSDEHARFEAKESLAFTHEFLEEPVVDYWAIALAEELTQHYPYLNRADRRYTYRSTIDIDNAFAYREKGMMRTLGGYARSLVKFRLSEVMLRTRVLVGKQRDPYDTYDQLRAIHTQYGIRPTWFFLLADYGVNDKNVPFHNRKFQSLIKLLADYGDAGIHPSFGSARDPRKLATEIERLSGILNREIIRSRQHFLKLEFPKTYRQLILHDVREDHTLGFASRIGFRAGTCHPYLFYDLEREETTDLTIVPFQVMDATLRYYMKVEPSEVIARIRPVIDRVREVKGCFVSLWHNESLSENAIWKGWNGVYEEVVREASKTG
ncbi:MAG: polysaccharide deacetylase family protein [Flavobacteriales bacterium]|nr:polysaccharide deacetylase family protein [Flavobacteriales bacterium]MCB9448820.1 polysaccharide deacetylase family protein [Flavobacteriales bacterium]